MKRLTFAILLLLAAVAPIAAQSYAIRMAESEMKRAPEAWQLDHGTRLYFGYSQGVGCCAMLQLWKATGQQKYFDYVEAWADSLINNNGEIHLYAIESYNIDFINPGKVLFDLHKATGNPKYKRAMDRLIGQLKNHPRTTEGAFWHKLIYPHQVWLDGLYMGSPFLAQYGATFNKPELIDDAVNQFLICAKHTFDPATGLYYHAWDESRNQRWADKTTGQSPNFWGRSVGWWFMALVDVLDYVQPDHPKRPELLALIEGLAQTLPKYQDASGLWYQVLDQGSRAGNYQEASVSSMCMYSFAKAVNKGYIDARYRAVAEKAFNGLTTKLIKINPDSTLTLTQCCAVGGLGGNPYRDGSFDYYVNEKIRDNDAKATGPFIMGCLQLETAWESVYPAILQAIKAPTFREVDYPITDFGAIPNDSAILNHSAINRAIATCSMQGGGRVIVPRGVWHTGPLTLKSNVNLHIAEGATLLFTTDTRHFPIVLTRWEGLDCYNMQPLIYAYGQTNIAITGKGTLDGAGENANWWRMCGATKYGWTEGVTSQRTGRPKLQQWAVNKVPVSERILTPADGMRPQMVNLYLCSNVLIEGVTLLRSPFWVLHPLLCENVTIRGVTIENDGPNGDGCDPESCKNVLIEDCFFNTGDDCIAIKSGRNNDGRLWSKPSENILVRNCQMQNGHGGVVIGSEISGGFKNLFVEKCEMNSPNLDRVIRIKTSTCRGGIIENLYVRDIEVGECKEAVLHINLLYEPGEPGERGFIPTVRNIFMERVTCQKSQYGIYIDALPNDTTVYNIRLNNCQFNGVTKGNAVKGLTRDIVLTNLLINGQPHNSM